MKFLIFLLLLNVCSLSIFSQPGASTNPVTVGISGSFSSLDPLTSMAVDQNTERLRDLLFNSLVKKNEKLDYVGDLAQRFKVSEDGRIITFTLRGDVKFHDGKLLTSADVKYTFDELLKSGSYKASVFFETIAGNRVPFLAAIETPDSATVSFVLSKGTFANLFLAYLSMIPIIPEGTVERQKTQPVGTGFFKFAGFNQKESFVQLRANEDYFDGAPKIQDIVIKSYSTADELKTALHVGKFDLAYPRENLPPEFWKVFGRDSKLRVEQFDGSDIAYLGFNTQSPVIKNVKVRRAIAYAIDRRRLIDKVLDGQARIAHSTLPVESWAYSAAAGKYDYNPGLAQRLLKQSGYKKERIVISLASGNVIVLKYMQMIQSMLREVGIKVDLETFEPATLRLKLAEGAFQMTTGRWVGGNQDPLFLKYLFWSGAIPGKNIACCNRSRYTNRRFDRIIQAAVETADREKARVLYTEAQSIINDDLPILPLWNPANMVVYSRRISDIEITSDGDWKFMKDLTVSD